MHKRLFAHVALALAAAALAHSAFAAEGDDVRWRKVQSPWGHGPWIEASGLEKARKSRANRRTVTMLSFGGQPAGGAIAAYHIDEVTFDCESAGYDEAQRFFDEGGLLIETDSSKENSIIPGVPMIQVYGQVCQGDAADGPTVVGVAAARAFDATEAAGTPHR